MALTEEDVHRIMDERLAAAQQSQINPETVQWLVRSAFEEAWRLAGGDPVASPHDEPPAGWRAAWMNSQARNVLVRNGMISGEDSYK